MDREIVILVNRMIMKDGTDYEDISEIVISKEYQWKAEHVMERFKLLKRLNKKMLEVMEHIDFSRVVPNQKWRALNIFHQASGYIFISTKAAKITDILTMSSGSNSNEEIKVDRSKAAKLESLGKVDEFGEQSVFGQTM